MRKFLLPITLLFALSSIISSNAYAQFPFGRALENAINRNVEKKIDQAVDESFDKETQKQQEKNKKQQDEQQKADVNTDKNGNTIIKTDETKVEISGDQSKVKVSTDDEDVTIEQSNELPTNVKASSFIGSFDTEMKSYKNDKLKDEPLNISYFIDTYKMALEMQSDKKGKSQAPFVSIFDRQKGTMTILQEEKGEKTAMVMKMPKITVKSKNNSKDTPEDVKFTKTGRTKTIDGHTCYEYIGETEKDKTTIWAAPDLQFDLTESLQIAQVQSKTQNYSGNFGQVEGMPLEMIMDDLKEKERIEVRYKNIKIGSVDASKFSTEGYKITDMSQFGGIFGK